jgi:hypothetical protein
MNRLWTFGASLAQLTDYRENRKILIEDQWLNQVANKLNYEHMAFGLAGSSHDYMYKKFYDIKNDIIAGDVVIIAMTVLNNRQWFFEDRPHVGSIVDVDMTSEELYAYKQYILHLDKNKQLTKIHLNNFFESLHRVTKEKNIKTIVFYPTIEESYSIDKDSFPNIYFVEDIFMNIIAGEVSKDYNMFELASVDKRFNHMTRTNHNIMADNIIKYLMHGKDITMSNTITNIINKDFFTDTEKQLYELFDFTWIY